MSQSSRVVELLETCGVEIHEHPDRNVKRGNVNIACPFCGDDPSWHLGINKQTGAWGCWRDRSHRGNFTQLLAYLKGISYSKALLMWKTEPALPTEDTFVSKVVSMMTPHLPASITRPKPPKISVMELKEGGLGARPFMDYMIGRNFKAPEIERLVKKFGIYYAVAGEMRGRIVFKVNDSDGNLTGYVGRAIDPEHKKHHTVGPINEMIWGEDHANQPGDILFVVEGVFDALRLSLHSHRGVRAVATLGASASNERIMKLRCLSSLYDKVLLFMDEDVSMANALHLQSELPRAGVIFDLGGASDPADMSTQQAQDLIETILGERECPVGSP